MGIRIGQSAINVNTARVTGLNRPYREKGAGTSDREAVDLFHPRGDREVVRVGFGKGTMSTAGAALTTIDRNLEEARRIVPSVEEVREKQAARRAELRAEQGAEAERESEPFRPEAAPQARRFVEREEKAEPPAPPPTEQDQATAGGGGPTPEMAAGAARLDVLA